MLSLASMPLQQQVLEAHPGPLAANRAGARVKRWVVSTFAGCGGMGIGFRGGFIVFRQHNLDASIRQEEVWAP